MSSDSPPAEAEESSQPKKPRSPVERAIVWGAIAMMLVIVAIEARAKFGYDNSRAALETALADNEEAQMSLAEARRLMQFAPSESGPVAAKISDVYTFSWFSLFKPGRYELSLSASRGDEPQVLTFQTANAPAPQPLAPIIAAPESDDMTMFAGGPAGGLGGDFQPPADPVATSLDADSDGELSTEELDNATAALLALDADGDGQLTGEELFPDGPPFGGRAANGQSDDDESGRPQRPELEEE